MELCPRWEGDGQHCPCAAKAEVEEYVQAFTEHEANRETVTVEHDMRENRLRAYFGGADPSPDRFGAETAYRRGWHDAIDSRAALPVCPLAEAGIEHRPHHYLTPVPWDCPGRATDTNDASCESCGQPIRYMRGSRQGGWMHQWTGYWCSGDSPTFAAAGRVNPLPCAPQCHYFGSGWATCAYCGANNPAAAVSGEQAQPDGEPR